MPIDIKYPGVYVEEDFSLSMSILAGATAVPVIADDGSDELDEPIRCNSWLEFENYYRENFDRLPSTDSMFVSAVRAYFENGGGYCYLLNADQFSAKVPQLDDVTMLVAAGQDISRSLSDLCGIGKGRFAILDGPKTEVKEFADWDSVAPSGTMHAAVYYPWLSAPWKKEGEYVPPSAAVAGLICSVDRDRGVWKAPANVELRGGLLPRFRVTDDIQSKVTVIPKPLNMIREFPGYGALVWGARTLDGDSDDWRRVPVRRLFDAAQRDIKRSMATAMFEANNSPTWETVRSAIDNYLYSLWRQGALLGNTPEEAYFVQIGKGVTMSDVDINNGVMRVKIGMAAVRPAEFIILHFTQEVGQG